ncbi:hypothetical protein [Novosphingobium lentum]|uniref:hypothetical protein n=1 Tax=Novosphingobium lentum TaxID=145287 RepID=UPI000833ED32|nr:hypothetical protein [Novosphingobium lentum]
MTKRGYVAGNGRKAGGTRPLAMLLFAPGMRPDADALEALAAAAAPFQVSHRPEGAADWLELLRDGLTFDLVGLAPGKPAVPSTPATSHDLPADLAAGEAIVLAPGPHLAGAEHLLPVVRVTAALVTGLAALPGLLGIGWLPARNLVDPAWFCEAVDRWLAGGPFAALALCGLEREADGALHSEGLRFLIGQEFRLAADRNSDPARNAKVALRLTDWLVAHGRVDTAREIVLVGAGSVWLAPGADGMIAAQCR